MSSVATIAIPEHRLNNIKMGMIADLLLEIPEAKPIATRGDWDNCFTIADTKLMLWYDRPVENIHGTQMSSGLRKMELSDA